jgi:dTDP-4-dehydrorhamnose 3,5-epimerase
MVLNLLVPIGTIRFHIVDISGGVLTDTVILSRDNYYRLTVMPGVWLGFEGVDEGTNLLLNVASVEHDPTESESCDDALFKSHFKEFFEL